MKQNLLFILFFVIPFFIHAQSIDLESFGKEKPVQVNGYVSANGVYYNSNQNNAREPFTYFLQGGINLKLYSFSVPISYSFTNQGKKFNYQLPFNFNRLSLHPTYKWISVHIGDVSMTFSPYTLSGHQFTGGGIDLSPKGKFKISAMYGRLLKATEDGGNLQTIPAFKRMGMGFKTAYTDRKYSIEFITFYAKDQINSIAVVPEDKGVIPKENLVLSMGGSYKLSNSLDISATYAATAITQDLRAQEVERPNKNIAGLLFNNRASTEYYKALKAGLNYRIDQSSIGLAYERIDPGYQTLGAYFFNNDFENITLNAATAVFNNKVNLAFNIGYQRDDLNNQKDNATNRMVGAVNASAAINDRLSITGSYSNFTTYTNIKVNQFDHINDDNLLDNDLDTLDYKQLSQNANLGINYILSKKEKLQQVINMNYNVSDVANEQNGIVRVGDASIFHNMNLAYTATLPKQQLNITTALNGTYNTIGTENATTWGPTLGINKRFFENRLSTGLSSSYNVTNNKTYNISIANIRVNASYILLKQHNFNLSVIQLFRSSVQPDTDGLKELTATLGYNYTFNLPPKIKIERKPKIFSFSYRDHYFEGEHETITPEVLAVVNQPIFNGILKINGIKEKLAFYEDIIIQSENKSDKNYRFAALDYLKYLYDHKGFLDTYNDLAFKSLKKLYREAVVLDYKVEKEYTVLQAKVNSSKNPSKKDLKDLGVKEKRYKAHQWMMQRLLVLSFEDILNDKGILKTFKNKQISKVFSMLENGKTDTEVQNYLEVQFADLYHKQGLQQKN